MQIIEKPPICKGKNRRDFITSTVFSFAGIGLCKSISKSLFITESAKFASYNNFAFKTSARLEMLPGKNIIEKVSNASKYGFDGISLPGRFLKGFIDELIRVAGDLPLPLISLSLGYEGSLVSRNRKIREKCRKSLIGLLNLCNRLKINTLNIVPAFIEDLPKEISLTKNELDELFISQLFEICAVAKERGVMLLLEAVNRYETGYVTKLSHAVEICNNVNNPNLGITADFYHMMLEELNTPESIRAAGNFIKHVHVAENTRVEPGPGSLNFKPGFTELRKIGYQGFFEIECRNLSGDPDFVYPNSINYLRNIWDTA